MVTRTYKAVRITISFHDSFVTLVTAGRTVPMVVTTLDTAWCNLHIPLRMHTPAPVSDPRSNI